MNTTAMPRVSRATDAVISPTELELHRAAAWWAGEGSVSSKDRKLRISFAQKEVCVCVWFCERFGGTVATRAATASHNEISYWTCHGDRARNFIRLIVDLLPESPRRQAQLSDALTKCDVRNKPGPKLKPFCRNGHQRLEKGYCKTCQREQRARYMSVPDNAARHRDRERARYQNSPDLREKIALRNQLKKIVHEEFKDV